MQKTNFKTMSKVVSVGHVLIGGENEIVIQSMLTADTMDTDACVKQCIRLAQAGCEIVRITAPSVKEAENLINIKRLLAEKNYILPLVADIHYTPNAAKTAADIVEKIRINPGNFVRSRKFGKLEELETIKEKLEPILAICKRKGTAIRIGVNHGSLSERITQEFGDTAKGMVESALEYLDICEHHDFNNIILSLKASNVKTMIHANRLMYLKMQERGKIYPLHLGVTEAGSGNDGRIKSAIGISSLLMDGIGDTIRVSLTEEPEAEIPVAKALKERFQRGKAEDKSVLKPNSKRGTHSILNIGDGNPTVVIADFSEVKEPTEADFSSVGHIFQAQSGIWTKTDQACDFIYVGHSLPKSDFPNTLAIISDYSEDFKGSEHNFPLFSQKTIRKEKMHPKLNFLNIKTESFDPNKLSFIKEYKNLVLVLESDFPVLIHKERKIFKWLAQNEIHLPVMLRRNYTNLSEEKFLLHSAADFGSLLIDGMGNGIWPSSEEVRMKEQNSIAFGILQASGDRISKTEYISCPSCGRAKFDVQKTKEKIEALSSHLKGLKIGIMGCIVNGPGEMADADYGYVGSGNGKITLYKGKEIVEKDIPEEQATASLIGLLKKNGEWK